MKKSGLRKWIIGFSVVVLLVPFLAIGAINYAGKRYASEIDDLLASLLEQDPVDLGSGNEQIVAETPGPPATTEPGTTAPQAPLSPPGAPSSPGEPPRVEPHPGDPVTPGPSEPPAGNMPPGIEASDQQTAVATFGQMSMSEKVTVLRTVGKFSTSEMLNYYKLYKQGDKEAIATIKSELKAKLTVDDYETIRQLAGKYRE